MITTRIQIESYLAEYVRGKYYDETVGTVRFPSSSDIYVTVYDLMEKRPVNCPPGGQFCRRQVPGTVQLHFRTRYRHS